MSKSQITIQPQRMGKILLIDDEADIREELAEALTFAGLECLSTGSCSDAMRLLRNQEDIAHVIIDLCLPELDGLAFVEKIRLLERGPALNIIVMTGQATVERAVAAIRLGIADFIRKPLDASEIIAAIKRKTALSHPKAPTLLPRRPLDRKELITRVARLRREKARIFAQDMIAEPGWDMLLELAVADIDGKGIPTTSLAYAANTPISSGLRRLAGMEKAGLITRRPDDVDRRRVLGFITQLGREKIDQYLAQTEKVMRPYDKALEGAK